MVVTRHPISLLEGIPDFLDQLPIEARVELTRRLTTCSLPTGALKLAILFEAEYGRTP
jgi:hypothetical protein